MMRIVLRQVIQLTVTFAILACFPSLSFGNNTQELSKAIGAARSKVSEFSEIARLAKERGLKAFLFGGSAASFAHYVRWDELRRKGDTSYFPERFDYDFTNIFRSNQDIDIVVTRADGKPESTADISALQNEIVKLFPYFRGNQEAWEVRGLKTSNGSKEALEENFDFINQNTDTASTGLIELTDSSDPLVRDLKDKGVAPRFLTDVVEGKISFYRSSSHGQTKRAAAGTNPEIHGAIRFLIKYFQFNLKPDPESLKTIREIIAAFNPDTLSQESRAWIEKNGRKLFQNATDLENAWNYLEDTGLRKKLIALGNPNQLNSLAWWMSKEPLRTKAHASAYPLKGFGVRFKPAGKTAGDLGISVVTHETTNWEALEAMTNSPKGKPNLLVSRKGVNGESAADGDGFYTKIGTKGARGTGFHIRFKVDPTAQEGIDFEINTADHVVWKTASKLTVIPDSVAQDPISAFEYLADPRNPDERGIRERLRRRLSKEKYSESNRKEFLQKAKDQLLKASGSSRTNKSYAVEAWDEIFPEMPLSEFWSIRLKQIDAELDDWVLKASVKDPSSPEIASLKNGVNHGEADISVVVIDELNKRDRLPPELHQTIFDLFLTDSSGAAIDAALRFITRHHLPTTKGSQKRLVDFLNEHPAQGARKNLINALINLKLEPEALDGWMKLMDHPDRELAEGIVKMFIGKPVSHPRLEDKLNRMLDGSWGDRFGAALILAKKSQSGLTIPAPMLAKLVPSLKSEEGGRSNSFDQIGNATFQMLLKADLSNPVLQDALEELKEGSDPLGKLFGLAFLSHSKSFDASERNHLDQLKAHFFGNDITLDNYINQAMDPQIHFKNSTLDNGKKCGNIIESLVMPKD